ncbi:MAG: haloacid dehalogenase type II [Candidatus Tectomicrobia bacterium]|nr:haloacid dehalogenase type II [Candidatus Tectomicrobia bacterium]
MGLSDVKAFAFDVFGTVVDWRGSLIREGEALGREKGIPLDWAALADAWQAGKEPALERIRAGGAPWSTLDAVHRARLDVILAQAGAAGLDEEEKDRLNRAWHRLAPWPDSVPGLARLKRRGVVSAFSNGNFALLVNMARHAGLPWDCVISADLFRRYKPAPELYLGAAELLGLPPEEVMVAAAHEGDLRAARANGLKTAYVARPLEFGPGKHAEPAEMWDVMASGIEDLAGKLGA